MTLLYGARHSFVLLGLKNKVKLLPQSEEKWICMGKWAVPNWGNYFHHIVVVRFVPEFSPTADGP